ncbi:hypothetical protein [Haloglomus halophilum]|uniref:hypothetical protein n=1 Tax=Haloglomus halophilum TaxID=2962672 RepID=UPI0020C94FEF|nr:hypothetical protein [Haloglomus halophilum]
MSITMELFERTPDGIEVGELAGRDTLLIGAAYVGKSHCFRAAERRASVVDDLGTAVESPPGEFVVVDDFYSAYQHAPAEDRHAFEAWLAEDRPGGVCLVTRPYDIDWLLESPETGLDGGILGGFDRGYLLRYSPEDDDDRDQVVGCCLSVCRTEADASLTPAEVRAAMDELFLVPEYEFDSPALREALGVEAYGETLVPALVVYLSDRLGADGEALLPGGVRNAFEGVLGNVGITQFLAETKEACSGLFSRETLADLATDASAIAGSSGTAVPVASTLGLGAGAAPSALVAGGSLALYLRLQDDDDLSRADAFDALLGDEMTPPARASLEAELGLPPRTVGNFRRLVRGDTAERLLALSESSRGGAVDRRLDEVEAAVESHQEDLRAFEDLSGRLAEATIAPDEFADFVAGSIAGATDDIEDLRETVRDEERDNVLQVGTVDEVPPYHGDEDDRLVELVEEGADLVVLRGSHGTGKTTAAHLACEALAPEYDVRLPNFNTSSRDALEYSLTATGEETVVFTAYKRGLTDETAINGPGGFQAVLRWLDRGHCSTVILECRDELYRSLDSLSNDIDDRYRKAVWRDHEEIRFDRLSNEDIEAVVAWTLDRFDYQGDRADIVREATRVADGNPEIAKIAARFALTDGTQLGRIDSQDELIWSDIDSLFSREAIVVDGRAIGGSAFEITSAVRRVRTDELAAALGQTVDRRDLGLCARYLSGYLGGDVRAAADRAGETSGGGRFLEPDPVDADAGPIPLDDDDIWQVSPDIYADTVFRVGFLEGEITDRTLDEYLDAVADAGNPDRYVGLAEHLGEAFGHSRESGDDDLARTVAEEAHRLLARVAGDDVPAAVYVECLDELVRNQVPVAAWHLREHVERVVSGTSAGRERLLERADFDEGDLDVDPSRVSVETLSTNLFGSLYLNHYEFAGAEQMAALDDVARRVAAEYERARGADPASFLENLYSMALSGLAADEPEPEAVADALDAVERLALDAAHADAHGNDPARFLENVYAMSFSKLAQWRSEPSEIRGWVEDIRRRTVETAHGADHGRTPERFLATTYAMTLAKLSDHYPDPRTVDGWVETVEAMALETATSDGIEDSGAVLADFYGTTLSTLAQSHPDPSTVVGWRDRYLDRTVDSAGSDVHDEEPATFLLLVFAGALSDLTRDYPAPDRVGSWVESLSDRVTELATGEVHGTDAAAFLATAYGTVLSSLPEYYDEPGDAAAWVDDLEARAVDAAVAGDAGVEGELALVELYSATLSLLANEEPDPSDVADWVAAFDRRAVTTATDDRLDVAASRFLENTYAGSLAGLAAHYPDPGAAAAWIDVFERRARETARSESHGADRVQFLQNVYPMALLKLATSNPDPDPVADWVDEFEQRMLETGVEGGFRGGPALFLTGAYGIAISRLSQHSPDPSEVAGWVETLQERTVRTARRDIHDDRPGLFLAHVYADVLSGLAGAYPDPAEIPGWVELVGELVDDATDHVDDEGVPLYPFAHASALPDVAKYHPDPRACAGWVDLLLSRVVEADQGDEMLVMALDQVRARPPAVAQRWYPALVGQTIETLPTAALPGFVDTYADPHAGDGDPLDRRVRLAITLLRAAGEEPPGTDHEDAVARVAAVLAATVHAVWRETWLDGDRFERIVDAVTDLADTQPEFYADLVAAVPDRLEATHASDVAALDWREELA